MNTTETTSLDRNTVIKTIKTNLQRRSGRAWSVTGGRGTAWGWLRIDAPPSRCTWHFRETDQRGPVNEIICEDYQDASKQFGHMSPEDRADLAKLLGLETVHHQGVGIPASNDYWREYLERSEGQTPTKCGEQYWD